MLPPLLFVVVLVLVPIVFIALFSVGLRTNVPGTPTSFSLADWKNFLTGAGGAFRGRFFYSMKITLFVSVVTTIAAYPLAYFLSFVARRHRYALLLVAACPVLHQLPAARDRLADHPQQQRRGQLVALVACTCAPTGTRCPG